MDAIEAGKVLAPRGGAAAILDPSETEELRECRVRLLGDRARLMGQLKQLYRQLGKDRYWANAILTTAQELVEEGGTLARLLDGHFDLT
ncbi:MAG: hypothetical protein ACYDBS_01605 [Acidimicrobiales bacterium]